MVKSSFQLLLAAAPLCSGFTFGGRAAKAVPKTVVNVGGEEKSGAYLEKDAEGLYYVALEHESGASAKAFVFGADVTSYKDASGTEWIAVRPDAKMDGSKPISGGLSHCFPQFGPGAIQQHGFARNVDWDIVDTSGCSVTFQLTPNAVSKAMWDEPFKVDFKVSLTATYVARGRSFSPRASRVGRPSRFEWGLSRGPPLDSSLVESLKRPRERRGLVRTKARATSATPGRSTRR